MGVNEIFDKCVIVNPHKKTGDMVLAKIFINNKNYGRRIRIDVLVAMMMVLKIFKCLIENAFRYLILNTKKNGNAVNLGVGIYEKLVENNFV